MPARRFVTRVSAGVLLLFVACSSESKDAAPATSTTAPATSPASSTTSTASTTTPASGPACTLTQGASAPTVDDRVFQLTTPAGHGPFPVLFNLHGSGSNAGEQSVYSGLPDRGSARGYLVVTPDGTGSPRGWDFLGKPDFAYFDAIIDSFPAGCVDPARLYFAGISLGSAMSAFTTCGLRHDVTAIGLVAATVYPPTCDPTATPVLAFHGTNDPLVPYAGGNVGGSGVPVDPAEAAMAKWAVKDGCSATPTTTKVADDVTQLDWPGCSGGGAVTLERIEGGGHTWPGSSIDVASLGVTTKSIDATARFLDFFDAH